MKCRTCGKTETVEMPSERIKEYCDAHLKLKGFEISEEDLIKLIEDYGGWCPECWESGEGPDDGSIVGERARLM